MRSRLIRPFLVVEFLIAIEVWLTFWSQVGGQYHLDLMFWPWKFGLTVAAAWLITAITAELFRGDPEKPHALSRRAIIYAALLFAVIVMAGVVTYYYHMNEPADEDNGDTPAQVTGLRITLAGGTACPTMARGLPKAGDKIACPTITNKL
jgi:hypothetical protein